MSGKGRGESRHSKTKGRRARCARAIEDASGLRLDEALSRMIGERLMAWVGQDPDLAVYLVERDRSD
jgi:hypothetical protein